MSAQRGGASIVLSCELWFLSLSSWYHYYLHVYDFESIPRNIKSIDKNKKKKKKKKKIKILKKKKKK